MGTEHEDPLERRRDELRRIVYGTPGGADAEAAVELASVEAEIAARAGDEVPAASGVIVVDVDAASGSAAVDVDTNADAEVDVAATGHAAPAPEEPPARRRPTRAGVLIAAVAALVLVVGGVVLAGPVRDALSPPRGLGVFEHEPLPGTMERADQVATGARLQPDEAATLRPLGRAFGYDFWVFRDDSRVCLLSQRLFFFEWDRSCATLQEFEAHGLAHRIAADDIRDGARPRRIEPGDIVVVTWGPTSTEIEWHVEP